MTSDVWIFGYGSLIFRPEFEFRERRIAQLAGFARRFWQMSPDHRGTPEAPGRVVTLVPSAGTKVLGVAYRVDAHLASAVLAELDRRERAGYERITVEIEFTEDPFEKSAAIAYQAREENSGFCREASSAEIARIVRKACGPSGPNSSYVRSLAQALRTIGEDDPHVFEVERLLNQTG